LKQDIKKCVKTFKILVIHKYARPLKLNVITAPNHDKQPCTSKASVIANWLKH